MPFLLKKYIFAPFDEKLARQHRSNFITHIKEVKKNKNDMRTILYQEFPENILSNRYLYHGTCSDFKVFKQFCHFGSSVAAASAWRKKFGLLTDTPVTPGREQDVAQAARNITGVRNANPGKLYEVSICTNDPLLTGDTSKPHDNEFWLSIVLDKYSNKRDKRLIERIYQKNEIQAIQMALLYKGYDSFYYENIFEHKGDISFVPVCSEQILLSAVISVFVDIDSPEPKISNSFKILKTIP